MHLALYPGPLRGGERAWYTLYAHVQSLRRIFLEYNSRDTIITMWSSRYGQGILSTRSLYFALTVV